MNASWTSRRWPLRWLAVALAGTMLAGCGAGGDSDSARPAGSAAVHQWVRQHAEPLAATDPTAPLTDLRPLRRMLGDAVVVGLGEATHGAHEQSALKHRVLRFLVERMGFRSVALEDAWGTARRLNHYVLTGKGNLGDLMQEMGTAWQTREMRAMLGWLRAYNAEHPDDRVRFVGVDVVDTRPFVYDAVARHVATVAPERLPELRRHFAVIRPTREDHVGWFITQVEHKERYVEHARQARQLVKNLPHAPNDPAHEIALQHARQIAWFYEEFTHQRSGFRDRKMARNIRWWRQRTGDKIAYWAASVHTADAPRLTVSTPPETGTWKAAGAYLREVYGRRYVSVGFTFDHGRVNSNWERPPFTPESFRVPPPPPDFAERPLGEVGLEQYMLNVRDAGPPAARQWLDDPAKTRVIGSHYEPQRGSAYYMTGGSLAQWFDVLVHRQEVTPTHPLR